MHMCSRAGYYVQKHCIARATPHWGQALPNVIHQPRCSPILSTLGAGYARCHGRCSINLHLASHVINSSILRRYPRYKYPDRYSAQMNLLPAPSELGDRGQATINPAIKAMLRMSTLKTLRQLSSFLGQLVYIGRFNSQPTWES